MDSDFYNELAQSIGCNTPTENKNDQHSTSIGSSQLVDISGVSIPNKWTPVYELLKSWGLEILFNTFMKEELDLDNLKYVTPFMAQKLVCNYPLGIQARFEYHFKAWHKIEGCTSTLEEHRVSSPVASSNTSECSNLSDRCDNESKSYTIMDILKCHEGDMIRKYYDTHGQLNCRNRQILTDIIVQYFIRNNKKMSVSIANMISNEIVDLFKKEIKEYYFVAQFKRAPKGRLYSKYQNELHKLVKCGLVEKKQNGKKEAATMLFETEEDYTEIVQRLRTEDLTWDQIETLWSKTSQGRLNEIKHAKDNADLAKNWKQYANPSGYRLVEIDYGNLSMENRHNILTGWDDFFIKVQKVLINKFKENFDIESISSEDGRIAYILWQLHGYLKPTGKKIIKDHTGKKCVIKYTIRDSQTSFFLFGPSITAILAKIEESLKQGHPMQPCIIVVGTIENPKEILTYWDGVKYKFFSILKAVDICFKLFILFDLQYPCQSETVWQFIQNYFYKIKTSHDKVLPQIKILENELNSN